ncbi:LysR family transcriptional regulator [Diaphorobacter caeni]|uniref:LysR family transcriptional regulator n=1 Tax=Diaphorobacter caeni TaxID=2784387 RepID=UPI00188F0527|nr:LysR family transcriptional regulator [Diaphorobacter caeni]MBF5005762.1 LysR family transcriptional regulator [Diaphorobacter caeni]
MDLLLNIEAFVRVAQTQNFSEAARQLRVAPSVVTTRIKQLEEHVGTPLFHRSTRLVRLTEIGQAFVRESTELVNRSQNLFDQMRDVGATPSGVLRVHALTGFVLGRFATVLKSFQDAYPDIRLEMSVSDEVVDPVAAGVDCALQIFPPASMELVSKQLFPVRRLFCATEKYLKENGTPTDPRDLHKHRLGLYSRYPSRDRWAFHRAGEQITLYLDASLLTNSVHLLRDFALESSGIVCVPTFVATPALLSGELTPVLSDYQLSSFWFSAVFPHTSRNAFKLRLFIEHIAAPYKRTPAWDEQLIARGMVGQDLILE